ncbi:unnamed protein product [Blepharisma stoltei]|uniref:Uncharacterized protein n=1 Tax=Blepharisma stoltei TaxID=1481888 RepID=A0AAU9I7Q9_9CILI|nr:unnamed protein product [Blepharisma stoltei]
MITTLRYSEGFFRNLSGYIGQSAPIRPQPTHLPPPQVSQPAPVVQVQEQQPELNPEPKHFKNEDLYLDYEDKPARSQAPLSKSATGLSYNKREWILRQRQDLSEEINKAKSRVDEENARRDQILKQEQEKINEVYAAQRKLEDLMREQSSRLFK